MVHHKDKKAAADFLDTAAGCMAVDKEDVVLASADFVAGGDCADCPYCCPFPYGCCA